MYLRSIVECPAISNRDGETYEMHGPYGCGGLHHSARCMRLPSASVERAASMEAERRNQLRGRRSLGP